MSRRAASLLATAFFLVPIGFAAESNPSAACPATNEEASAILGMPIESTHVYGTAQSGKIECQYGVGGVNWAVSVTFKSLPYFEAEKESGQPFGTGTVQGEWDEGKKWMKKRYPIVQIDGLGKDAYFYPTPAKNVPSIVYVLIDDMHVEVSSAITGREPLEALARKVVQNLE